MSDIPDRLHIDKGDRGLYERLENESLFEGTTRKEQFLLAMAIGFKSKAKRALTNKESGGFFRTSYLRPEDEALMNAVALCDCGSVDLLPNRAEVFRIAEEYAHGGIRLLVGQVDSTEFGSLAKHLEKDLFTMYSELDLDSDDDENTPG